ncbi:hypothetical protein [Paenibacillus taichungensis]
MDQLDKIVGIESSGKYFYIGDKVDTVTLFYYIAASHELPTGSFEKKKTVMTINNYVTNMNPAT